MPLHLAKPGTTGRIKRVLGRTETRLFLEKLGFVPGAFVTVVSETDGNIIVNIKDSRVAVGRDMALKIQIA